MKIIDLLKKETLFIPDYDTTYKDVIERYQANSREFGLQSYEYKIDRIDNSKKIVIGYLSGTFDLFHIGHLNLIKRAKKQCDYCKTKINYLQEWYLKD